MTHQGKALCAVCGSRRRVEGHHVVPRERIRFYFRKEAEELFWHTGNGLAVCADCHRDHTTAFRRIPLSKLRSENIAFATRLGLFWYLEMTYGGG